MESLTNNIISTGRDDDHEIDSGLETEAINCSFSQSSLADSYVAHSVLHSQLPGSCLSDWDSVINPIADRKDIFIGLDEDADPDINFFDPQIINSSNYYVEDDFIKLVLDGNYQTNLKILHLNIRSYFKNQTSLWTHLDNIKHKFHIIALTETWTTEDNEDHLIYPGYNTYFKSRAQGIHGGVALLIDNTFQVTIIDAIACPTSPIESIFVNVSTPCGKPLQWELFIDLLTPTLLLLTWIWRIFYLY